jgi:hypothetical protein
MIEYYQVGYFVFSEMSLRFLYDSFTLNGDSHILKGHSPFGEMSLCFILTFFTLNGFDNVWFIVFQRNHSLGTQVSAV